MAHPQQPCKFGYIFEPDFPPGQNGDEEVYEEGFFLRGGDIWRVSGTQSLFSKCPISLVYSLGEELASCLSCCSWYIQ